MSVVIEKNTEGFLVRVYNGINRPIRNFTYTSSKEGIRLINESGGYFTPEGIDASLWTVDGVSGFANDEALQDALDAIRTGIIGEGGSGGGGNSIDISSLSTSAKQDDLIAALALIKGNTDVVPTITDYQEITTDGTLDLTNCVNYTILFKGNGGTLDGENIRNNEGITSGTYPTNAMSYTVPTSGQQRVLINYTRTV